MNKVLCHITPERFGINSVNSWAIPFRLIPRCRRKQMNYWLRYDLWVQNNKLLF